MRRGEGLSTGRQALSNALQELEQRAFTRGQDREQAIVQASEALKEQGYKPNEGRLGVLSSKTVSDWFRRGTPASDFQQLWAVVRVLLEWSEDGSRRHDRLTAKQVEDSWASRRKLWKGIWERAREKEVNPRCSPEPSPQKPEPRVTKPGAQPTDAQTLEKYAQKAAADIRASFASDYKPLNSVDKYFREELTGILEMVEVDFKLGMRLLKKYVTDDGHVVRHRVIAAKSLKEIQDRVSGQLTD